MTPAPPPENAEKRLEISEIKNKKKCSNKLLSSYHCTNSFISK